jgi:hypothetical protein
MVLSRGNGHSPTCISERAATACAHPATRARSQSKRTSSHPSTSGTTPRRVSCGWYTLTCVATNCSQATLQLTVRKQRCIRLSASNVAIDCPQASTRDWQSNGAVILACRSQAQPEALSGPKTRKMRTSVQDPIAPTHLLVVCLSNDVDPIRSLSQPSRCYSEFTSRAASYKLRNRIVPVRLCDVTMSTH